ncbi:hypothetical protein PG995_012049 [Apiospora arundinis]
MARERDTDTTLKQELGKRFASLTLEPEKPKEPTKQELEVKFAKLTLRPRKIKGHFNTVTKAGKRSARSKPTSKAKPKQEALHKRITYAIGRGQAVLQLNDKGLPEIHIEGDDDAILWQSDIEAMFALL